MFCARACLVRVLAVCVLRWCARCVLVVLPRLGLCALAGVSVPGTDAQD